MKQRQGLGPSTKVGKAHLQFEKLLVELSKRDLPYGVTASINKDIEEVNSIPDSGDMLLRGIKEKQAGIVKLVEQELKLVPKSHYRNLWLAVGMSSIGLPIGAAFGLALGNMAFLGLGLPLGLAIGSAVGARMDQKALEEGRQLDLQIK